MENSTPQKKGKQNYLPHILAFVFAIALTAILFINRDQVLKMAALGYPGIFIASLLANATLVLPVPGVLIPAAMGAIFNPFWVAVAAGSGAALGEITGYMAGYGGQAVVEEKVFYEKVVRWMKRYGDATILVLAIIPNPLFDVAGIAAGMLRMPLYRFLLWCWIGKIIKMMVFSYGGMALGSLLQ